MRITVPGWEEHFKTLGFGGELGKLPEDHVYEFDFSNVTFVTPGWLIVVGSALRRFREARPHAKRQAINFKHLSYASHVGFFKYFGVEYGLAPAEAEGSSTYVPITEVSVADIKEAAAQKFVNAGEIIEDESRRLATLLCREESGSIVDTLTYSLREIVRNVIEHSGSPTYTISAQFWPAQGAAELAVCDSGCGIFASLKENPRLQIKTDSEAIQLAILPGISSKAWRQNNSRDAWVNSGYGLFMTQRLCSQGGEFTLLSGSSGVLANEASAEPISTVTKGAIVILKMNIRAIDDLRSQLSLFQNEGREIARKIGGTSKIGPSLASQILRPSRKTI